MYFLFFFRYLGLLVKKRMKLMMKLKLKDEDEYEFLGKKVEEDMEMLWWCGFV